MSLSSSNRQNKPKKDSIYREVSSGRFIAINTINEIEDIIDTSEAYMTSPTVIFNSSNNKVLFYYNTKNKNEIEEMETLFKGTVRQNNTITLSDAFYLNESSGDDTTYDISGTYTFEKYDENTKTIVATPISLNKQSTTYSTYNSRYWLGSLLWTTAEETKTRTVSYEIVNFIGNDSDQSFSKIFGTIQNNDKIEVVGLGTFTVIGFDVDSDEGWERIKVKEKISENDYLGELKMIRLLRSDINRPKNRPKNKPSTNEKTVRPTVTNNPNLVSSSNNNSPLSDSDSRILKESAGRLQQLTDPEKFLRNAGMSLQGIDKINAILRIQESRKKQISQKQAIKTPEQSPKNKAKQAWLMSGSKTLNITVISTSNGYKFSINGDDPSDLIELDVGDTVLVKQSDKSNGASGFTRNQHPIRFSIISDGPHRGGSATSIDYITKKQVGNNNSYYYFTVPNVGKLFYYCENHPNMGGKINLVRERGACCSILDKCKPGEDSPRRCYSNRSKSACESDSGLYGTWYKGKDCIKGKGRACCDPTWEVID